MSLPPPLAPRPSLPILLALCLCALGVPGADLAAKPARALRAPAAAPDVTQAFEELARQRPWDCHEQPRFDAPRGWQAEASRCAWQERLRVRSWTGPGGEPEGACVSMQARWWAWAHNGSRSLPPHRAVWQGAWTTQTFSGRAGAQQRIVLLARQPQGQWRVTEWRWDPSPRAATRRWQEGRWALLAARAAELAQPLPQPAAGREAGMIESVLLSNVGARVAEMGNGILNYESGGMCLQVDMAAPGQQQLQLSYSTEDSRLEQRAAMQLQLARRFPKATWLSPFNLLPMPPTIESGAKFYAVWIEGTVLKGQLWIPTKGDGPLVRIRLTTALPPGATALPDSRPVAAARKVVERELMGLAARWTEQHE